MTLIFQKIKKYQFDLNVKNNQNEKNIGNFCKKFTIISILDLLQELL